MATSLSNLITRMNIYTPIYNIDETRKVNAIDMSIRLLREEAQPPWLLKQSTLKVFDNVFQYPIAADHFRMGFLTNTNNNNQQNFFNSPRYIYTSLIDFLQDPDYRNRIAEIYEMGTRYLAVRNKSGSDMTSTLLATAQSTTGWTTSGDAGTPTLNNVVVQDGNYSICVPITLDTGTAEVSTVFTQQTDVNYQNKYFFYSIYLAGIPDSIELKVGTDSANYLSTSVTTQYANIPFVANSWNLLAIDLSTATATGTFTGNFSYQSVEFTNAPTGFYYFDNTYLRGWIQQLYYYYSLYNVIDANGTSFKNLFSNDGANYDPTDQLIGDDYWSEVVWTNACLFLLSDSKEQAIKEDVMKIRDRAWTNLIRTYPDISPRQIANTYRFDTDYTGLVGYPNNWGVYG